MAYAFVKSSLFKNTNPNSFTPTNATDLLVLVSLNTIGSGNGSLTAVSDSVNGSWTQGIATVAGSGFFFTVFYLLNCSASAASITCTYNGGATPGSCDISVLEYSGIATSSALIGVPVTNPQSAPGTGANALTSGALNVTTVPALVLGLCGESNSGTNISAGTGYTARVQSNANNFNFFAEDLRATVTGNQTATATAGVGTDSFITAILAFAEPAPAASPVIAWVT